jgi:DNA polymerase-3 subunit alpha
MLKEHSEGIIISSACLSGILSHQYYLYEKEGPDKIIQAMKEVYEDFRKMFKDDFYAELQWHNNEDQHKINYYLIRLHLESGVPLVSTCDCHYPKPELWLSRYLYKKLGWLGKNKEEIGTLPKSVEEVGFHLYPKTGEQIWNEFKEKYSHLYNEFDENIIKESIENTYKIAHEKIEDFIPDRTIKLPSFIVPKGKDENVLLKEKCILGLKEKGLDVKQEYCERLERELRVIKKRDFSKYFLAMKEISDIANEIMTVGSSRGSAGGSLVAYVLNITQVDPIKFNLLFERFLDEESDSWPDIDFDVSKPMELKEKLIEKWGSNSVVPISNYGTFQLRSLIKDISRFYNIPFLEVNNVTSRMIQEATVKAKEKHDIKFGVYVPTFEEVIEFSDSLKAFLNKYPEISEHVNNLQGAVKMISRHAGGVILSEKLDTYMPLISSGGVIQSPWCEGQNVRHLEPMGFIKFDLLGLTTLEVIENTIKNILIKKGIEKPTFEQIKEFYKEKLHPDSINFNDKRVWKQIFRNPNKMNAGIFQWSGLRAQMFSKEVKPESLEELSMLASIQRPGPMGSQVDKTYQAAKKDPSSVIYEHPILEEILSNKYGHIIFQEDLAMIAHRMGKNISLTEGNKLRKVLIKKGLENTKNEKVKTKIYNKFVEGCLEKNLTIKQANKIWERMEYFSAYGFSKNHIVGYSMISYICAWLLTYYPDEWIVSFLDKEPESKKEKAVSVAESLGYKIQTVDINKSDGYNWKVSEEKDKVLIQPLASIKGFGNSAIEQIINNRPFKTIEDLLFNENIVYNKLNKARLDVLVRSGTIDCLFDNRFSGFKHFWSCVAVDRVDSKKKFEENIEIYRPEGDFLENEKIEFISSLTGYFPLSKVLKEEDILKLDSLNIPSITKYDSELKTTWFIVRNCLIKKTKNNKDYYVLSVTDNMGANETIKCWGINIKKDKIETNKLCIANLDYSEVWGFSVRNMINNFKVI